MLKTANHGPILKNHQKIIVNKINFLQSFTAGQTALLATILLICHTVLMKLLKVKISNTPRNYLTGLWHTNSVLLNVTSKIISTIPPNKVNSAWFAVWEDFNDFEHQHVINQVHNVIRAFNNDKL